MTVAEILRPEDVVLDLVSTTAEAAIAETAAVLKDDARVLDWNAFYVGLCGAATCLPITADFAICIPHVRTDHLSELVMSVGRAPAGILFPGCAVPVRYCFCIGVQHALAADYLRIVGMLERIVKIPQGEARLRAAETGTEFVEVLLALEAQL
ncbi:MAG TPA: PTS sugar transporter subunit IIA [Chthoniobacteraceae bacterium]|nr:PTS sugar transporter subunit IIA [Chthoniobacteraceae bacterium]